ncbi:hypothetical protein [Oscillatoria sp. FACHB-1406]|uniref:hypothetical protein n=1 Tax=Oscillatoria sp. FACHB-1406 TaxID=2692846 RepID=UPI001681DD1A|nr:hypothetical protein [Oscillatoria sp. FACHB-1406]MBD2578765.1 hypothetical protein [Oscillatoria sp. FACHB-1406]
MVVGNVDLPPIRRYNLTKNVSKLEPSSLSKVKHLILKSMNLFYLPHLTFFLAESETSAALMCKPIGAAELTLIIGILGGLVVLISTAGSTAITLGTGGLLAKVALPSAITGIVTKVIAGLGIGASITGITIPLQPFLEIAAVKGAVDSVKAILECHSPYG